MNEETTNLADVEVDPNWPPAVVARLRIVDETTQRNVEAINARIAPRMKEWGQRLNLIIQSRTPNPSHKYRALYRLADEVMSHNGDNVACKRGCSHCCHIAVGILEPEAKYIGRAIGVEPARVKGRRNFAGFDYGYHNPCPFLRDGECSIYEHRPLACRLQYSMDADALLCELRPPASIPVPFLNTMPFQMAAVQIGAQATRGQIPKLADIREFFPRGKA